MDRWLEAYAKWTPSNQVVFAGFLVMAGLALVGLTILVLNYGLFYLSVWARGWPTTDKKTGKPPTMTDLVQFVEICRMMRSVGTLILVPRADGSVEVLKTNEGLSTPGPRLATPLPDCGEINYKEEIARLAEEQRFRDAVDAANQEAMEQANHPSEK